MTDLYVRLESQATFLRAKQLTECPSKQPDCRLPSCAPPLALATLIDGTLAEHDRSTQYFDGIPDQDQLPRVTAWSRGSIATWDHALELLTTYVSAVTGNTPPEGAP